MREVNRDDYLSSPSRYNGVRVLGSATLYSKNEIIVKMVIVDNGKSKYFI